MDVALPLINCPSSPLLLRSSLLHRLQGRPHPDGHPPVRVQCPNRSLRDAPPPHARITLFCARLARFAYIPIKPFLTPSFLRFAHIPAGFPVRVSIVPTNGVPLGPSAPRLFAPHTCKVHLPARATLLHGKSHGQHKKARYAALVTAMSAWAQICFTFRVLMKPITVITTCNNNTRQQPCPYPPDLTSEDTAAGTYAVDKIFLPLYVRTSLRFAMTPIPRSRAFHTPNPRAHTPFKICPLISFQAN